MYARLQNLSLRPYDTCEVNLMFLLKAPNDPECFQYYVTKSLESPYVNHEDLVASAWDCAILHIRHDLAGSHCSDFYQDGPITHWSSAILFLLENGADIHGPFGYNRSETPVYLAILTTLEGHNFDADVAVHAWLKIVKTSRISVETYLTYEVDTIPKSCVNGYLPLAYTYLSSRERRWQSVGFDGLPALSCRWVYWPGEPAFEVLREFQDIKINYAVITRPWRECPPVISRQDDFKAWIHFVGSASSRYFLFCRRFLHLYDGVDALLPTWHSHRESYKLASKILEKRLERREVKKWRKANPGKKLAIGKMPGSWVD